MTQNSNVLNEMDKEKSYKTQVIIGMGLMILTTFLLFWMKGIKVEGIIAGDMVALVLGTVYMLYLDRTKINHTNKIMAGVIVLTAIRFSVAIAISSAIM